MSNTPTTILLFVEDTGLVGLRYFMSRFEVTRRCLVDFGDEEITEAIQGMHPVRSAQWGAGNFAFALNALNPSGFAIHAFLKYVEDTYNKEAAPCHLVLVAGNRLRNISDKTAYIWTMNGAQGPFAQETAQLPEDALISAPTVAATVQQLRVAAPSYASVSVMAVPAYKISHRDLGTAKDSGIAAIELLHATLSSTLALANPVATELRNLKCASGESGSSGAGELYI
eukprot:comp14152_c0_seq1/m.20175 comp14152_c0_seq1/g.20175  ORF comp14152_c0_seq1/g.20175 comp14152_c0_seq1/m.20175 type:complete len:227 (-) comp14152_c0_seq1:40-720(-)